MTARVSPHGPRLAALRAMLEQEDLNGFIVPRADEQLGEYVPDSSERLRWLTGFTGSAGLAIVLRDKAAVFGDGRYTLQLDAQTDGSIYERHHILKSPPAKWLAAAAPDGAIGYDPKLFSQVSLQPFIDADIRLVAVEANPIDRVWSDRPAMPAAPIEPHPIAFSGKTSTEKRTQIAVLLKDAGDDGAVISDPASIAWLLNIRAADVRWLPGIVGTALIDREGLVELFVGPGKVSAETRAWLGNQVSVSAPADLAPALSRLAGKRVRVDQSNVPVWFSRQLHDAGATVVKGADPCLVPKARKNATEQEGLRRAHVRDGIAMAHFLSTMEAITPLGDQTELSAARLLNAFRAEAPEFREESFHTISSAGPNAALNHYQVTEESNRRINPDELFLCDSGGQYPDGTTDVTRTIWTGAGEPPAIHRDEYTRVLKGLISLETLVFPEGTAGVHVDAFARRFLWEAGLDYDHGTGHGVGHYLGVHEGPASISKPLRPDPLAEGMLMSNEPGYYVAGSHGIRLENLMFVMPAGLPRAMTPFLRFESITLVPFDRRLIEKTLLDPAEIAWVDTYHRKVEETLAPDLEGSVLEWIKKSCAPL